jgi:ArsR family metal-binding transcriptional regulator
VLLKNYTLEIFNSKCRPGAMGVHCFAHFGQDVTPVLPYLNAVLGGFSYADDPPALTLRSQGKLITVLSDKAAINALKDEQEARTIVEWLKREINAAWDKKDEIEPSYEGQIRPKLFEILKLLPKTNCRKCGQPTCTVFAAQSMEGGRGAGDCPELTSPNREKLAVYLAGFSFD